MSKVKPRTKLVAIHPVHGYAIPPPQDVKVSRRNARERNRVKTVNNGFEVLKRHIPSAAPVKKMSKVNILTQAVEYIECLQGLLKDTPPSPAPAGSPYPPPSSASSTLSSYSPAPGPGYCYPAPYHAPTPPLTPISPNTLYYPHYPTPTPTSSRTQYESGYDSHGEGAVGEGERKAAWHHPEYHQQHQHHHSPNPHYLLPLPSRTQKQQDTSHDSSGEEDDILDAIAEWQQH